MRLVVKIELPEYEFEQVCKLTIAGMLRSKSKINKGEIISMIKHEITQKGEYYINFTGDANDEGSKYLRENEAEVDAVYNRYFQT